MLTDNRTFYYNSKKGDKIMPIFQKQAERVVSNVLNIPVSLIEPNPAQPREYFDDYALTQLAVSIQQNGIVH